jgi:REP element-mobilizing transposase RayT
MNSDKENIKRIKRGLSWVKLKNALQQEGCFICTIVRNAIMKYFDNVLYEYALDASVHKKIISAMGLCNTHIHLLLEIEKNKGDGLSAGSLFETTLRKEIRLIDEIEELPPREDKNRTTNNQLKKALRGYKNKIKKTLTPAGKCIGCEQQNHTESFYTHETLRIWNDEEFQELYAREKIMLCRSHFINIIDEAENKEVIDYFISSQKNKLDSLNFLLSEFIRKHDYRFQKEITDEDRESWTKVLEYLGSKKGVKRKDYDN